MYLVILFAYAIYLLLATISIIFLNLLIGAVSDTQSKAQVYSIFPMLIVSFLPIIALQNDTAQKSVGLLVRWSYCKSFK